MAVIQKIRERYAKLAGFIIGLSLVAFIISEGINGSFGNFFGKDTSVAKVDGKGIEAKEYYEAVQDYQSLTELYRKGQPVKDEELAQMRQGVLDQLINEKLIEREAKKLGLVVSEQEQKDMLTGPDPDPTVRQFPYFAGQDGQFDPQIARTFESQVKKVGTEEAYKALEQWKALQRFVIRQRLVQKYTQMVSNSAYSPKYVLTRNEKDGGQMASVRFVKIPYTTIPDANVTVNDQELTEYMNKHKSQYEIPQPTRSIDYVVYDVTPDGEDTAKSKNALTKVQGDFASTGDNEKFVTRNSDEPYIDAYLTKKSFPSVYADSIFSQPVGSVYGPYFENGSYRLSKVVAKNTLPDSVKFRQILITMDEQGKQVRDSVTAKRIVDSIYTALSAGTDFKAMAIKYNPGDNSNATGGEGEVTLEQSAGLPKEFSDFIFQGKTGEKKIVKVANAQYTGYHLVEILSQKDMVSAVKLANISKSLITSSRSSNAILSKANKFAGMSGNGKAFDENVKKDNLNLRVAEDIKAGDFVIQNLGAARELIVWAYNAKEGDVSNPIQLDKRYVVAKLTAVQEAGLRKLNPSIRAAIEGIVKADKKAKLIADKYKASQSIDAVAQAAAQQVMVADSVKGNASFVQSIGYEPKVLGYAFSDALKLNALSPAIKGRDGVFYISVTRRDNVAVAPTDKMAMDQQTMMEAMQVKNYMGSMLTEALKKGNKITYNPKNIN